MNYHGGKSRLAKKFIAVLRAELNGPLYEPFVGGFNIIPAFGHPIESICSDVHPGLIMLYQACQEGWIPPASLSEKEYQVLRDRKDWTNPLTAFAAFGCSFGGKEWGGYARDGARRRNYCGESQRSLLRKVPMMANTHFLCIPYTQLNTDRYSLIYCDPPYKNTLKYRTGDFDHGTFYTWCEQKAAEGHVVLVSEFSAPAHWEVVWSVARRISMAREGTGKTRVDKLFRVVPSVSK